MYADAGFAQFKAGNMLDSIKLLNLALQKFEMLPQDNTRSQVFYLKETFRIRHKNGWQSMKVKIDPSELKEPPAGFCSDPETNEKFLTLPDSPIGYSWLYLAQIECKFGHGTIVFQTMPLQIADQKAAYPELNFPPFLP